MRSFTDNMYNRRQFAPPPSDAIDVRVLLANTAERHQVPTDAKWVIMSGNVDFYAKFGTDTVTAAVPSVDVTDGSASEQNPEAREIVTGITHISLISASAAIITLSWYS